VITVVEDHSGGTLSNSWTTRNGHRTTLFRPSPEAEVRRVIQPRIIEWAQQHTKMRSTVSGRRRRSRRAGAYHPGGVESPQLAARGSSPTWTTRWPAATSSRPWASS